MKIPNSRSTYKFAHITTYLICLLSLTFSRCVTTDSNNQKSLSQEKNNIRPQANHQGSDTENAVPFMKKQAPLNNMEVIQEDCEDPEKIAKDPNTKKKKPSIEVGIKRPLGAKTKTKPYAAMRCPD
ncbi:MAG: hypothetical protein R3B45_11960 [Bdellovibrionota bacterium]